ncbi:hypothetical protein FHS18_004040 [Paenibacillus phyllosphaerae]|uniref:Uncharacterized protein n=1 Tax=Paenibacillus phyllosphaerae TaxID=274593 RepID=A0A7W5FP88_9BACL|nr:DNA replication protein DnaD [Paenibacillus phyllosphaerae]MBB3111972.1 hypothetical protein [Paenibacillus phyllosphaerae]
MADRRMLSRSISISEKVNLLPDVFDMLLFTWMIPHTDDFGRLHGSPAKVRALIIPMLEKSNKDVERSLTTLHNEKLIQWYEVDGDQYIQVVNFEKHQTGLHKRTKSKIPENPQTSGKFPESPAQGKGIGIKGSEQNGIEENVNVREGNWGRIALNSNSYEDRILNLIKECQIKSYNQKDLDLLFSYIGENDIEVIEVAVKKASGKEHLSYAIKTLQGMIKDGKTKKEHVMQVPRNVTQITSKTRTGKFVGWIPEQLKGPEVSVEEHEELVNIAKKLDEKADVS